MDDPLLLLAVDAVAGVLLILYTPILLRCSSACLISSSENWMSICLIIRMWCSGIFKILLFEICDEMLYYRVQLVSREECQHSLPEQ